MVIGTAAEGFNFLNRVRVNRGLLDFEGAITAASLARELRREYEKEFFAEGQLFYFYKRRGIMLIPSAQSNADVVKASRLPIPQRELESRGGE
jgi:hypothetical protein